MPLLDGNAEMIVRGSGSLSFQQRSLVILYQDQAPKLRFAKIAFNIVHSFSQKLSQTVLEVCKTTLVVCFLDSLVLSAIVGTAENAGEVVEAEHFGSPVAEARDTFYSRRQPWLQGWPGSVQRQAEKARRSGTVRNFRCGVAFKAQWLWVRIFSDGLGPELATIC